MQTLAGAGVQRSDVSGEEKTIECFASPAEAYSNAVSRAKEDDRIAVFGSFLTVAGVMAAHSQGRR
jgi:dihydrofolate synthase/folylpolyglutamate synthase